MTLPGKSDGYSVLNVGSESAPDIGPANRVLFICGINEPVNVPVVVTGEPDTLGKKQQEKHYGF